MPVPYKIGNFFFCPKAKPLYASIFVFHRLFPAFSGCNEDSPHRSRISVPEHNKIHAREAVIKFSRCTADVENITRKKLYSRCDPYKEDKITLRFFGLSRYSMLQVKRVAISSGDSILRNILCPKQHSFITLKMKL